jgi:Zn-dependent alcohol dehydrogenase
VNFGFACLDGSNALTRSGIRGHFFGQSSFSTHSLATKRNVVPVPQDLPLELLAPLGGILKPRGRVALLTGNMTTRTFPQGKKTVGIIQGDAVPQHFIPQLIDLYRAGRFPFDRLVKFYDFKDINQAIADSRKGDTIKPVLRIGKS